MTRLIEADSQHEDSAAAGVHLFIYITLLICFQFDISKFLSFFYKNWEKRLDTFYVHLCVQLL